MTDKPTDEALENLFVEETGFDIDDFPAAIFGFARAVLAKWGQPAQAAEPVAWVWRFSDGSFCETPFETQKACAQDAIGYEGEPVPLYLAPQPVAREQLADEQIQDLLLCGNPTDEEMRLIRIGWDAANGIKGGQHGAE